MIVLIRWWKIGLEKTLLIGTLRTFVQLTLMGYVLTYFFGQHHWTFMVGLILLMIIIAGFEGSRRQKNYKIPHYFLILVSVLFFTVVVVLGIILSVILTVLPICHDPHCRDDHRERPELLNPYYRSLPGGTSASRGRD
jgi:putative ABC transport system permease protein